MNTPMLKTSVNLLLKVMVVSVFMLVSRVAYAEYYVVYGGAPTVTKTSCYKAYKHTHKHCHKHYHKHKSAHHKPTYHKKRIYTRTYTYQPCATRCGYANACVPTACGRCGECAPVRYWQERPYRVYLVPADTYPRYNDWVTYYPDYSDMDTRTADDYD